MQVLSAKVRLDDKAEMIINKSGLTPADIHLLRHIHGYKAVSEIKVVGEIDRTSAQERKRVTLLYGMKNVLAVFPTPAYPLPQTYEDEGDPTDDLYVEDDLDTNMRPVETKTAMPAAPAASASAFDPEEAGEEEGDEGEDEEEPETTSKPQEKAPAAPTKTNDPLARAREARARNIAARKAASAGNEE